MRRRLRGYTLLETLIAFAVVAMVLALVLPGQAGLLRRANEDEARLLALDWAMSVLEMQPLEGADAASHLEHRYNGWTMIVTNQPYSLTGGLNVVASKAEVSSDRGRMLGELTYYWTQP